MKFDMNTEDCELLLAFEKSGSLKNMSGILHKDLSVISRQMKAIAEKSNVLEKAGGRWVITDEGRALNRWSEEAIFTQKLIFSKQKVLKIATTREFAARILIPETRSLVGEDNITISILSSDSGIEKMLLAGQADFGIDCGRPHDPMIAFQRIARESFVCVAAPKYMEKYKIKNFEDVKQRDHLRFIRTQFSMIDIDVEASHYFGSFSDIATLREAALLGYGWAIIPYYTVAKEIKEKKLKIIEGHKVEDEKFGVWWPRERKTIQPWVNKAITWLKFQESKLFMSK